jgi:citrate lyase subunit beta / citryl-CoA lyase
MIQKPLRSVLYVPASNAKALAKIPSLECDAVIIDLEDAVHPDAKDTAREAMREFAKGWTVRPAQLIIRINPLTSEWGTEDFLAAVGTRPDAILLPKTEAPADVLALADALNEVDAPLSIGIWAMIETPKAIFNAGAIAELARHNSSRLTCFVTGTNDLMKETGVRSAALMQPWLMQIVLAAKAGGLCVLDGVHNDFADSAGFDAAAMQARDCGFDGKTLIHPSQIASANRCFSPTDAEMNEAQTIVDTFELEENVGKGVVNINGRMVERLHLEMAQRIIINSGKQS